MPWCRKLPVWRHPRCVRVHSKRTLFGLVTLSPSPRANSPVSGWLVLFSLQRCNPLSMRDNVGLKHLWIASHTYRITLQDPFNRERAIMLSMLLCYYVISWFIFWMRFDNANHGIAFCCRWLTYVGTKMLFMLTPFSRRKKFPISSISTSLCIHRQSKTVKDWQWFWEPNKSTRRCEHLSIVDIKSPSGSGPKLSPSIDATTCYNNNNMAGQ